MGSDPTASGRRSFLRSPRVAPVGATVLAVVVLAGPRASFDASWNVPDVGADVEVFLAESEAAVPGIRPDDQKEVVWADPASRGRTPLGVVYLHGFSADRHEVEPLVSDLARDLGANTFFTRLRGHGRDEAAMGEGSVAAWATDAAEAIAIGGRIGQRVVLVGTSTGGTLALWAAAQPGMDERLAALVLISPNLGLREPAARMLLWPWGALLAHIVVGPERCFDPASTGQARHWTTCYPTRALLPMVALTAHVRSMDVSGVRVPTLVVYSPDDEDVDPARALGVLAGLGSGPPETYVVDEPGDPSSHVVAGDILSPATTDAVRVAVLRFLEATLDR